jgi:UDP-N-acetyl-D-glucosamine dehydrogenase
MEEVSMELPEHIAAITHSKHVGRELARKIRDRSANVGVIGLGYTGLQLALEMAEKGFRVTGIDFDGSKVDSINAGISYVVDVQNERLYSAVAAKNLRATQSFASLEFLDTISICVPTPLGKTTDPNLAYMIAAVEAVHNHLKPGKLIVLESTIYPGTTRETVLPILEKSGLRAGRDFFLAYSPKRVNPRGKTYMTRSIPKVIGGMTPRCTALAALLYHQFVEQIIPVSSSESAEMVKFLENTFRSVNIALANEMARMCLKFGANVWEVIELAKSKPFDFMPFYPGPEVGGDCIAIDPYYLNWKARISGFEPRLSELAGYINSQMPAFTVSHVTDALNQRQKSLKGSKILVLGVTYKRNTNDIRESPALEVLHGLYEKGAFVYYSDPYVPSLEIDNRTLKSTATTPEVLQSMDCVLVLTDHSNFNYEMIAAHSFLILDKRNALKDFSGSNIIRF